MSRNARIALLSSAAALLFGAALADRGEPEIPVLKFSHEDHEGYGVNVKEGCGACHGDDPKGALAIPAAKGHKPCLEAGCHAADFLAIGERTRDEEPARWRKAASFCRGCHTEPPTNFQRAPADSVYRIHPSPEHHVELDHFEHTKVAACRDCHKVHPQLVKPGHAECAGCHGESAPPMTSCATCHQKGAPETIFTGARADSRIRSCNTPDHLRRARKLGRKPEEVPCFSHETEVHRFWSADRRSRRFEEGGEELQCSHCHTMIADQSQWRLFRRKYRSLADIKAAPIMENRGRGNRAHQACGAAPACHQSEVRNERTCRKCHDHQALSLFD